MVDAGGHPGEGAELVDDQHPLRERAGPGGVAADGDVDPEHGQEELFQRPHHRLDVGVHADAGHVGEDVGAGFAVDVGAAFGVDDVDQPAVRAGVRGGQRGGGCFAAAGAGRDEQVRFLVFQVGDPFPAAGQGGQVDAVRGLGVAVEQGAGGRGGRVPPGRGVRPEGGGEVAAEVAADDLVDVLLLGRVGVPRGRVGQGDHRVRGGGEAARDIQPAQRVRGGVGAEVAAQLQVDGADHRPQVPCPPPAGGQRRPGRRPPGRRARRR